MRHENIHYEVLGQRGTSWTIVAVVDEQEEAMNAARTAKMSYRAVKVMRERFDPSTNTYRSGQIFYSGPAPKVSKYDPEEMPGICWKFEDFYSYEGRRSINRLLRAELVQWGLTATELIHSLEHVERLQDHGTALQRAVQQTAIAQIRETGQGVQERIKQIYELIDIGTAHLRRDKDSVARLRTISDSIDPLVEDFAGRESRAYLLNTALTRYLGDVRSYGEKLSRITALVRDDHPAWVHEVVDSFVGEILTLGNIVHRLVGERLSLKDELATIADLTLGRLDAGDHTVEPAAHVISRLIRAGKMPCARQSLEHHLIEQLRGKHPLVEGDVAAESSAAKELMDRLRNDDGSWIGDMAMMEAAGSRCSRWLNPETIAEFLAPAQTPEDRAARLMELEPNVVGAANKRRLAEYLLPIIVSPQAEVHFTGTDGGVSTRMKAIAGLQNQILASGLQEMHMRRTAERLDAYCCKLMQKARMVERLTTGEGSVSDKCIGLLKMIMDGYFTVGNADAQARQAIRALMAAPTFAESLFAGVRGRDEKIARLEGLQRMLFAARIEAEPEAGQDVA
ncbi:MAG: hypothetical protein VYB54_09555 [Pseudomonadota bacterium]|nr:hypothetical protein [Pseudomonadota bacterium]